MVMLVPEVTKARHCPPPMSVKVTPLPVPHTVAKAGDGMKLIIAAQAKTVAIIL